VSGRPITSHFIQTPAKLRAYPITGGILLAAWILAARISINDAEDDETKWVLHDGAVCKDKWALDYVY
jgi:hypothetical protein